MQLGAWRLRRCISRRAAQIESFFESRESPKHWGFSCSESRELASKKAVGFELRGDELKLGDDEGKPKRHFTLSKNLPHR